METMTILPGVEGKRFGTLSLGYDRIITMRGEFTTLADLVSLVLDVPVDKLTVADVQRATGRVQDALTHPSRQARVDKVAAALPGLSSLTEVIDPLDRSV